uniref:FBD domain-containing protein n=2 Tax=Chenopodium quinoa TaxID=63459 RepID=A0A803L7G7_CHEQI
MREFFGSLLSCQMLVLHKSFWYTMRNCKLYCDLEPPEKLGKDLESLQTLKLLEASSFEKCSGKSVQNKGNFILSCLKYVEFVFKEGMELIKVLLACSPALEEMTIVLSETSTAEKEIEVAKELMRYDRASPNAEIILKP